MLPASFGRRTQQAAPESSVAYTQLAGMEALQRSRALLRVNAIADRCFHECVTDFGFTKHLKPGEEQCLAACVDKFLKFSLSAGDAFADVAAS